MHVTGSSYGFSWSQDDDELRLLDARGRTVLSGPMQPAVVVRRPDAADVEWSRGRVGDTVLDGDGLTVTYTGVNGDGSLTVRWRFEEDRCWLEPVTYEQSGDAAVVALHYFAAAPADDGLPDPGLSCRYLVHPGVNGSGSVSPIVPALANLDTVTWLGRGGPAYVGRDRGLMRQQWGLPSHYLAGVNSTVHSVEPGALTRHRTGAFCVGLADLPAGDLMVRLRAGRFAPVVQLHGDLWGHLGGAGTFELGARLLWVLGDDYRDAISRHQRALVAAGVVSPAPWSEEKARTATASQFNTWGAQLAAGQALDAFDEAGLLAIRDQLAVSGLRPEMFVVDDKWESTYGLLEHSAERFPRFDEVLGGMRESGFRVGLWAAFLRCEDPGLVGLTKQHMLRGVDGDPVLLEPSGERYFLFDVTQPDVQSLLRERVARFVERYRPHLVKFDFGYEIPALSRCAPDDMAYAGERLLFLALDVVVGALREADPDIVVMYNSLSPLLTRHIDVHGLDDMWMNAHEYHLEANRRMFFASILGELGVPTYGSGGYDWTDIADIWFDSAAVGSLGSLGSFTGDLTDSVLTPRQVARFNGLGAVVRRGHTFTVAPLGGALLGSVTGARTPSWVRREDGEVTLVALRVSGFAGLPGHDRVEGLVTTDVDLVLSSLDGAGITASHRLGLVPCGTGRVELDWPPAPGAVTVREHTLDGGCEESVTRADGDRLVLTVREDVGDRPVTWMELVATTSGRPARG